MANRKYTERHARTVRRVYRATGSGIKAAEAAGTNTNYAYRVLRKAGLTNGRIEYSDELVDEAQRLYVEEELACSHVADRLGVSDQWVYEQMRDRGVIRRKNYDQHAVRYLTYNGHEIRLQGPHGPGKVEQILDEYVAGKSPSTLEEEYDVPVSSIEKWTTRAGVVRNASEAAANRVINEGGISPVWMARQAERLYVEEEMSLTQVADELECSTAAVLQYLRNRGVETRTQSEGLILSYWGSMEKYARFCRRVGYAVMVEGRTQKSLCEEHDVSYPTIRRALDSEHNPYDEEIAEERRENADWWTRDYKPRRRTAGLNTSSLPAS